MPTERDYKHGNNFIINAIYYPAGFVNAAAPQSLQITSQLLNFACTGIGVIL